MSNTGRSSVPFATGTGGPYETGRHMNAYCRSGGCASRNPRSICRMTSIRSCPQYLPMQPRPELRTHHGTVTRFPAAFRPWCHSGVVHPEESYEYIRNGFFMERLKLGKRMAGFFAGLIEKPLLALVHMNRPITAYHDITKCLKTINTATQSLLKGENQLIFSKRADMQRMDG